MLDCELGVSFGLGCKSDSECLSNTSCKAKKSSLTTKEKMSIKEFSYSKYCYLHLGRQGQSAHVHWEPRLADLYQLVEAQSLSEILLSRVRLSLLLGLQGCSLQIQALLQDYSIVKSHALNIACRFSSCCSCFS